MSDFRLYRLAFGPALAMLAVLAFSLDGVPAPTEPPPATITLDGAVAAQATRAVLAAGESRPPGSAADSAAADLVRERFEQVTSGEVAEQRVEASVDGEDVELRNVILTLPGETDRAILLVAGRDSRQGPGAPASAAATGLLLALTDALAVADRERTLVIASTSGAGAEAEGARELVAGLPDRIEVDAAVVIAQPGALEPVPPHLVTAGPGSPSAGLVATGQELLRTRSQASAGLPGAVGQIARLAFPPAAGEQAALMDQGLDAVAISSAGEVPLSGSSPEFDDGSLARFGPAVLGMVGALDAAGTPVHGPERYVRIGANIVPGWALSVLALTLLVPPLALTVKRLGRAEGRREPLRAALAWGGEWALPAGALLGSLYLLALPGLIPGAGSPYDPGRFGLGWTAVTTLLLLLVVTVASWWRLGLRRLPADLEPRWAGAACGGLVIFACVLAWLANPFLALVLAPLSHVAVVLSAEGRRPARLAPAVLCFALVPLLVCVGYLASALDWGLSAPWQLVALTAGGGLGAVQVAATLLALTWVAAVVRAALLSGRRLTGPFRG